MIHYSSWLIIPAAFALDAILGDPWWLPHPVRWMGGAIDALEPLFRKLPIGLRVSGGLFAVLLIAGTWGACFMAVGALGYIHPAFKTLLEVMVIYYCISMNSLQSAAVAVYRPLREGRLDRARSALAMIVGREVSGLPAEKLAAGAVETVAENLVDGFVAPLFFTALGGAPLALGYKMINTLDSMIGYKNADYIHFGKAAARIDDAANYIPARLSVPIIALAAAIIDRKGKAALKTARMEGRNHTSPNAGLPEAAFAGALGVKLGGPSIYHGQMVEKPYIGNAFAPPKPEHVPKACDLMMFSAVLWVICTWAFAVLKGYF